MRNHSLSYALLSALCLLPAVLSAQMTWNCATNSAPWGRRSDHASVVFDGKMWLLGGFIAWPDTLANDVWWSTDGADWRCATASAGWSDRGALRAVVYNNCIWVTGGWQIHGNDTSHFNDVWFSSDGENWTCATASAPWTARYSHEMVVFHDTMWLMGGADSAGNALNDVWYSTDGTTWTQESTPAPFARKGVMGSAVYDGKVWLTGGYPNYLRDVWCSDDCGNWTQVTVLADWQGRAGHTSVVFDGEMWVIGGCPWNWVRRFNDVWYSTNGDSWTCADSAAEWRPRGWHTSVVHNGRIWVIGGDSTTSSLTIGEVWYSRGLSIEEAPNAETRALNSATVVRGSLRLAGSPSASSSPSWLLDAAGRCTMELRAGENDIRNLSPGIYFVRSAVSGRRSAVHKIVVTK